MNTPEDLETLNQMRADSAIQNLRAIAESITPEGCTNPIITAEWRKEGSWQFNLEFKGTVNGCRLYAWGERVTDLRSMIACELPEPEDRAAKAAALRAEADKLEGKA